MIVNEYIKRLQPYHKVEIVEVKDYTTSAKEDLKKITLKKEEENILKVIGDKDYVILLALEGKQFDSIEFSKKLEEIFTYKSSKITFIIGGSMGVSKKVKARANLKWSFSKLTFPHQLFRAMLLEQIYRSFKINRHEPYHK